MKFSVSIFFSITIGYILGTIIGININFFVVIILLIISSAIFFFSLIRLKTKDVKTIILCSVFSLFLFLGSLNFQFSLLKVNNLIEKDLENKSSKFIGIVVQDLTETEFFKRYIVLVSSTEIDGKIIDLKEQKIITYVNKENNLNYGNLVIFNGVLEKIKNFDNEGNFDLSKYRIKDSIIYSLKTTDVLLVRGGEGNFIANFFLKIRNYFAENIKNNISEPGNLLVSGMTIAGKGALPKDLKQSFIDSGLIHIVVLSGYNISLLALGVSFISSFLRYRLRLFIIFSSIIFFVLISGGEVPIIRASIMASIILLGKFWNRKLYGERVLLASAFLMTLLNPFLIPFDPSFVLSFLATLAVIFVSPILKEWLKIDENNKTKGFIIELLSVQLFVAPYILFMMGQISIISPLTNILALPLVPIIMVLGIFIGIFGSLSFVALFGIIASIIAELVIIISEFGSSLSFSTVNFTFGSISLTTIYVLFSILLYGVILKNKERKITQI